MTESVIVAIITAIGAVAGQWIISSATKKKQTIEEAKREQRLNDRLEVIEHKIDDHNGYAEKFTSVTTDIAVIKTEIQTIKEQVKK